MALILANTKFRSPKKKFMVEHFGITERLSSGDVFDSILKLKFQDFHVREIDSDGQVLFLDELISRSDVATEVESKKILVDAAYQSLGAEFVIQMDAECEIAKLVSEEDMLELKAFLRSGIDESKPFCVMASSKLNESKDNRKQFHDTIRRFYGEFLVTDTLESDEGRSIRVWIKKFQQQEQLKYKQEALAATGGQAHSRGKKRSKPSSSARDNSGISVGVMMKDPWPKDRADYLHFRMYKENRDTAEAIQSIARCLRIPPKSFQFCGTKDRRGITVQSVSVYRISEEALKRALLHSSWDKAVRVSHLEYKEYPNKIGRSRGNQFEICLRRVSSTISRGDIDSLFENLKKVGFLNYYGLQRFGTRAVRTHQIGGLLLKGDWKGVVDALLSPEADNRKDSVSVNIDGSNERNEWRSLYAEGKLEQAHEMCPSFLYIEKSLLRALHQSGQSNNYLNAIQALPPATCHMYLHSVQSLAFNFALSHRIRQHGMKVVVGDLVATRLYEKEDNNNEDEEDGSNIVSIETEEEAALHSIYDVVLTLVGDSVRIPPNLEKFYNEFFKSNFGFESQILQNKSLPQIVQLRGAYRKAIQRPDNMEWNLIENVADEQVLIKSDVDKLKQSQELEEASGVTSSPSDCDCNAVVFKCDLRSGVYLTMALREVSAVRE